jgi:hypothetical protein
LVDRCHCCGGGEGSSTLFLTQKNMTLTTKNIDEIKGLILELQEQMKDKTEKSTVGRETTESRENRGL